MRSIHLLPLSLCVLLAACTSSRSTGPLMADARSPITDIPVPVGFSMTGDSQATTSGGKRLIDHRYTGKEDVLPVASFYKEQMPTHGWKLDTTEQPSGKEVVLHFKKDKATETCVVTVSEGTWSINTVIHVRVDSGQ